MTQHQAAIEGFNRISCALNGDKYVPPASLSAMAPEPEPRRVKSLGEILDAEHAASLESVNAGAGADSPVPVGNAPVLLSADAAAARTVKPLSAILNSEDFATNGGSDSGSDAHRFRINTSRIHALT